MDDFINRFLDRRQYEEEAFKAQLVLETIKAFLQVLDSFDRVLAGAKQVQAEGTISDSWIQSFDRVRTMHIQALESQGVEFTNAVGKPFDPELHNAVSVVYRTDLEDHTVVEEIVRGCDWRGNRLRIAQVVISSSEQELKNWRG